MDGGEINLVLRVFNANVLARKDTLMKSREFKKFDETRVPFRNVESVFKNCGVLTPDVVKQLNEDFEGFKNKLSKSESEDLTIDKILVKFDNGFIEIRSFPEFIGCLVWMDLFKSFFWAAPGGLLRPKSPIQYGFYHKKSKCGDGTRKTRNVGDPSFGIKRKERKGKKKGKR